MSLKETFHKKWQWKSLITFFGGSCVVYVKWNITLNKKMNDLIDLMITYDALRDLVPFVQSKRREKY